jgi:DNA-nicking Smr family endonuclease
MSNETKKTGGGDDAQIWQKITSSVTPLKRRRPPVPAADKATAPLPAKTGGTPASRVTARAPISVSPPPVDLAKGGIPGLDKRAVRSLRRGTVAIDGRLDLHGLTQPVAHQRLGNFLARAQDNGFKMVLVITGKGLKLDGSVGVLREAVPRWLNEAPNRSRVLGFTHAAQNDGGTGALYVRLRKKA